MARWRVSMLGLLAAVLTTAWAGWVRIDTDHFSVYGDPVSARSAAVRMEEFHGALSQVYISPLPARARARTMVLAFPDGPALRAYGPTGDPNVQGVFYTRPGTVLIGLATLSSPGIVEREYVQQAFYTPANPLPLWLAEGLAEYFASAQKLSATSVRLGAPMFGRVEVLRDQRWIPLDRLLTATPASPEYDKDWLLFYAQSWILVHWCMTDPEGGRRAKLAALASYLDGGATPEEAVQGAFQLSLADLTATLGRYAAGVSLPAVTVRLPAPLSKVKVEPVEIPDAERDAVLGRLEAWAGRTDAAREHLFAAVSADPNLAIAWEATAEFADRQGDARAAEAALAKAVAAGSTSASVHYAYALALAGDNPPDLATIRAELARALELEPDLVDAYVGLVDASLLAGDPAAADAWVEKGLQVDPSSSALRIRLAESHARHGRPKYARATAEKVLATEADAKLRARAQAVLDRLPVTP